MTRLLSRWPRVSGLKASSQRVTRFSSACSLPKKHTRTMPRGSKAATHLAVGFFTPLATPDIRSPCSERKDTTAPPSA